MVNHFLQQTEFQAWDTLEQWTMEPMARRHDALGHNVHCSTVHSLQQRIVPENEKVKQDEN